MSYFEFLRGLVAGTPASRAATVQSVTGAVYTIDRMLGSASTLALMAGTNGNLTLAGSSISATLALAAGASQTALVREVSGAVAVEYPVTLSGAVTPTLTLTGSLAFTTATAPGTLVATIGHVPAGTTPTLTPDDGRLVVAGNTAAGWTVVVGLSAATAGTIAVTVAAAGANPASANVTVSAATNALATLPVLSGNAPWAYGLNRVVAGYAGSALRVQRVADSAQADIGFAANGAFDSAAATAFQGSSQLRIVTWYEQGGSDAHLTQLAANAPVLWLGDGGPLAIDGLGWSVQGMVLPSGVAIDPSNMAVFMAAKVVSLRNASTSGPWQFGSTGSTVAFAATGAWATNHYGINPIVAGAYATPVADNFKTVAVSNMSLMGVVSSASGMVVHRDEQTASYPAIASAALSGGQIMKVSSLAGGQYDVAAFVIYPLAPASGDVAAIKTALQANCGSVSWAPAIYGHFQGDSRYKGDGVVNDRTVPAVLADYFNNTMLVRNFGEDGDVFQSGTYWTASTGRIAAAGLATSFCTTRYGHNNVKASGQDAPTLIAAALAYYTNMRASGLFTSIVGCTELPDKTLTAAQIGTLQAFNAWMRSDPRDSNGLRIFDAIVDNAWDPALGDLATYTNGQGMFLAVNSADGVHPSEYAIKTYDVPQHLASLQLLGILPATGAVTVQAPVATAAPAVTGTAQVGQVLSASSGLWQITPGNGAFTCLPAQYRYQWYRGGAAIAGATASAYTPVAADLGAVLACAVMATNAAGFASATSAATSAVMAASVALALSASGVPGSGTAGTAYAGGSLSASGGMAPYVYASTALPAGLSLNTATGAVSGTPTASGSANVTFTVTDAASSTATVTVAFTINAAAVTLAITGTPTTRADVGVAYASWTATASGGVGPYTYADVNAALPAGLAIHGSTGVVSGTPTAAGTFGNVIIQVADSLGSLASIATFSITVAAAEQIGLSGIIGSGTVGAAYTGVVAASGGTAPYTYASTALPAGLSLNPSSGAITGSATAVGATSVTFTVTDAVGGTASGSVTITMAAATCLLDKLSTNALSSLQAAKSVRQLRGGYGGNALDVLVGSTTTSVGFSSGSLNTTALAAAAGASSATVTQWYEQSLSGTGSATQTSAAPRIVALGAIDTRNGKPSILFATGKEIDDPASSSGTARTLVFVTSHDNTSAAILASPSATGGLTVRWSSTHQLQVTKTASVLATGTKVGTLNALSVVVFTFDGSDYQLFIDGQAADSGAVTATTFTAGLTTIIGLAGTAHISEYLLFDSALSATDIAAIQADAKAYYGTA